MDRPPLRARVAELAQRHLDDGDPLGWFEVLYQRARGDEAEIPWADMSANPMLERWLAMRPDLSGRAAVVGCGLGDDAELLARSRWDVTAFDISETSVAWCRRRFPDSKVDYQVADLFAVPSHWLEHFELVVEIYTVQSLPLNLRRAAIDALISMLTVGGRLWLMSRGRDDNTTPAGPPWALSVAELEQLTRRNLSLDRFEDFYDDEDPPKRRFVGVYRRRPPGISPTDTEPPSEPDPDPDPTPPAPGEVTPNPDAP